MEETKKQEHVTQTPVKEEKTKQKSNTLLYIIIGIVVFITIIGIAAVLVVRSVFKKGTEIIESELETIETVIDEEDSNIVIDEESETWMYKKTTEQGVGGELEKTELINKEFPEDIPLSGGVVTSSSFSSGYSVDVSIDVNSTVEEIIEWYAAKLEEAGWVITDRSVSESMEGWVTGNLKFESDDTARIGRINTETNPYQDFTSIKISEYLY